MTLRVCVPNDTEQKKRANFEREDGATRHVSGPTWAQARTTDRLTHDRFCVEQV